MKYPSIAKQPRRVVSVPALSGGVNLRDSISMINDNQLTDCKNVWEKGGVLETRPPCKAVSQEKIKMDLYNSLEDEFISDYKSFPHIKREKKILCSCKRTGLGPNTYHDVSLIFWFQDENGSEDAGYIQMQGFEDENACNWFVIEKDGLLYCYVSNRAGHCAIYSCDYGQDRTWYEVARDKYYVPLVVAGCKVLGFQEYSEPQNTENDRDLSEIISGTQIEGYNLIGGYYRMQYTKINREICSRGDGHQYAAFKLLHSVESGETEYIDGSPVYSKVTLKYLNSLGITIIHETEIRSDRLTTDGWYMEYVPGDDGCYLAVKGCTAKLCYYRDDGPATTPPITWILDDYVCENDLEITAPCPVNTENLQKVFRMTQAEWFGGSAKGINGGGRLFLTGNTELNEGALVIWSGFDNPLYFSENNYAYVGNKSQNVTAFGKQGEKLIIFKENETYYTTYQENDSITADDLIDQNIIDLSASSVYFPMVLINGTIGCDCPDTVQLCRNRLVWAHSCGKVYTLSSENQYSERTIFEVSEMIGPRLKTESGKLKKATSADFEGYYMLFVENRVYLMSYNSYGYQYVYSFSKNEDANLKIPWYIWELPLFIGDNQSGSYAYPFASVVNDKLILTSFYKTSNEEYAYVVSFLINPDENDTFDSAFTEKGDGKTPDKKVPIESYLQTKIFDFGAPNYRKNVETVQLSLGNNGGAPIEIQYITDSGSEAETIVLSDGDTEPRSAAYVTSVTLNPCIKSVLRFGMKLSCKGILAVDSMSLHYRLLGGAR